MTRDDLAQEAARLTALYHDALLVDILGERGSGLGDERLAELREEDLLIPPMTFGDLNPLEYIVAAGHVFEAQPERLAELREFGVDEFTPLLEVELRRVTPSTGDTRVDVEQPDAPSTGDDAPRTPPPPPEWMSVAERGAYERLALRSGEYIRGLGNALSAELEDVAAEGWEGETIIDEVIPDQREAMLAALREEAANESATGRDARRLAGTLADRTGYYAHNWLRIAQTELQGAHNEGRVIAAVEARGEGALVARVPESGACSACLRVFANPDGSPRVFRADELAANGVNVGRSRAEWLPTVFPVHPNCRCDTISVPDGFEVTPDGRLRRAE
jgi:hypothetical protein